MRKLYIKQLYDLIKTLDTACRELEKQKNGCFLDLCAVTQEFVSGMYDYMETVADEGSKLSELLRRLYELLYDASQDRNYIKQILETVNDLKEEVDSFKADKIEVVFFCYRASMSDSLESVYFAAKEDPSCDAYFIPVPYFDRGSNGNINQIHFEGEGYYSDQYELTDWKQYDVQARHPDVIFIMNPYDNRNLVTSLHPDFYSSHLKNHTDMLVYIEYGLPYWLYRDPCAKELQEEYEKNGIVLPAHIYSDYDIRYAKELAEVHKPIFAANPEISQSYNITPEKIQEKFVPLGSPKFDKILNTGREDYVLPEKWKRKTEGKKIILYNTGLAELLKSSERDKESEKDYVPHGSRYFEKLCSIIESFGKHEDVILWWRPHPLLEATLRSMRPVLLQKYLEIVNNFKNSGKGIFDDTEDLHRAIAWSDGMISDESSLLLLYTATGKPFYIPSITKALSQPVYDDGEGFYAPLAGRLKNMRAAKGANVGDWNCCIWWDNFLEEDVMRNTHFNNYTERFMDFVLHPEKYPDAEEYRQLQIKMFKDFVVNPDGTAGRKIYEFVKKKAMGQKEVRL